MVYPAPCLVKAEITPSTTLEFPLKNGEPDKSQPKLINIKIVFTSKCNEAHIDIRKDSSAVADPRHP